MKLATRHDSGIEMVVVVLNEMIKHGHRSGWHSLSSVASSSVLPVTPARTVLVVREPTIATPGSTAIPRHVI